MNKISIFIGVILVISINALGNDLKISGAISELDNMQKLFSEKYIQSVNSDDLNKLKSLIHPKCLAYITEENKDYFDEFFSRRLGYDIPKDYESFVRPYDPKEKEPFADIFIDVVTPTYYIQISYNPDQYTQNSILMSVIKQDDQYFEVIPCPTSEGIKKFREAKIEKQKREKRVKALLSELKDPLLSEIKDLLNQGKKIQAIKRYRNETGESLSIAKEVIELLKEENKK